MISFSRFIEESISKSRRAFLHPREARFKKAVPQFSDDEIDDHITKHFPWELRNKVSSSAHDPKAPIDVTRELPESVRALGRAATFHFNRGAIMKSEALKNQQLPDHVSQEQYNEGHKHIIAAMKVARTHLGDHYADMLKRNETRQAILPKLFAKGQ